MHMLIGPCIGTPDASSAIADAVQHLPTCLQGPYVRCIQGTKPAPYTIMHEACTWTVLGTEGCVRAAFIPEWQLLYSQPWRQPEYDHKLSRVTQHTSPFSP